MGSPTRSALAITDRVLTNLSIEHAQAELVSESGSGMGMTASFTMPFVPHSVEGLTGEFGKDDLNNAFQDSGAADGFRGPGTNYSVIDFGFGSDTYRIEDTGYSKQWDDDQQSAVNGPYQLNVKAQRYCTKRTVLRYARAVNSVVTTAGNFTNNATAASLGGQWSTSSTDIIAQVAAIKKAVHKATGDMIDSAVIGADVWWDGILKNDAIIAGLNAMQQSGGLSDFQLPRVIGRQFFDLDLRVDTTLYDSANPTATDSLAYDFGKNALFFKRLSSPQIDTTGLGMTIFKTGDQFRMYRWNEAPKMHWVACSLMRAIKLVQELDGYLVTSVVA
jgi:hypothetical protein